MLENSLYTITNRSKEEDDNLFTVEINSGHEIFKGHFPDMPVMPGVCSLLIIKRLVSEIINKKLHYYNIKECKFISAILPEKCNIIDVKITISNEDDGIYKIVSDINYESKIVMKLKANMK